jgi:hypothetical protein
MKVFAPMAEGKQGKAKGLPKKWKFVTFLFQ